MTSIPGGGHSTNYAKDQRILILNLMSKPNLSHYLNVLGPLLHIIHFTSLLSSNKGFNDDHNLRYPWNTRLSRRRKQFARFSEPRNVKKDQKKTIESNLVADN